ncbi:MAG: DUF3772 domain-containing protein [Pseudomonadota bacterium]
MRTIFAWIVAVFLAFPAWAQTAPDYDAWEGVATRAEAALEFGRASSSFLESLREEVDDFRGAFLSAQGTNTSRLATLREQLAALGPAPAEGETEAEQIAAQRAQLNRQLTELQAPGLAAAAAFQRADGVIREIDELLRDRRAEELFRRGPTLVDTSIWGAAFGAVTSSFQGLNSSISIAIEDGTFRDALRANLPAIILLLVVAMVLTLRARTWLVQLGRRIEGEGSGTGLRVSGFLISLGQIVVPTVGLFALSRALLLTGLFESYGAEIVAYIPEFGFTIFVARWLAGRLFPGIEGTYSPINTPHVSDSRERWFVVGTGLSLAVLTFLQELGRIDRYGEAARVALELPTLIVVSAFLFSLGRILSRHTAQETEDGPRPTALDRLVGLLARLAKLIGIAAPLIALAGYLNAAEELVTPSLITLALVMTVALLVDLFRDLYMLAARRESADDSLIPVLIAIALMIASIPVMALIWGATVTDLREVWVTLQAGITVGETRLSPSSVLILIVVFVLGFTLTRFVQSALRTSVLPKTALDLGGRTAVVSGVGYIGIFLAALVSISSAGINLSSLAIVAGALSVGIGFGLQNIVSNFVSGIILLIERPISEGDWIEVGGNMGYVRDISVRSTRIETFDRTDVIVPNADLVSGTVTNYTRGNTVGRVIVPVGVAYGTDTRRVETILREIAEANPMVMLNPPPAIVFMGFGADSLDFEIRAILRDVSWMLSVKSDMNHAIAARFTEEDIEIPFAQRDVWLRNPEALTKAPVHDMDRDSGDDEEAESAPDPQEG